MTEKSVFGERPAEVGQQLMRFRLRRRPATWCVDGALANGGPLMRALCRAEAELLLDDAVAMRAGRWGERTPDQRRRVAERLQAAVGPEEGGP